MNLNLNHSDIEQFLFDVRNYFRASLETSEYENASNIFHINEAEASLTLLLRCEQLLELYSTRSLPNPSTTNIQNNQILECEEDAYMSMNANTKTQDDFNEFTKTLNNTDNSDETIEKDDKTFDTNSWNEVFMENQEIYDTCNVTQDIMNKSEKVKQTQAIDCPYKSLSATHLAIQKSSKYGQLQRIERRLFFDQSKKCYCGILNDWFLCYADGPTSSQPMLCLHLKSNGIEIEHAGEGKRREICFQIKVAADPNKKFIFQAANEVDAKEWIHAIETVIRNDSASVMRNARKLPSPPVVKKPSFNNIKEVKKIAISHFQNNRQSDCIYEEPELLYYAHEPTELLLDNTAHDDAGDQIAIFPEIDNMDEAAAKFQYDIPKCPPQPLLSIDANQQDAKLETTCLIDGDKSMIPHTPLKSTEQLNFNNKLRDVQVKLSNQFPLEKKNYSCNSSEFENVCLTTICNSSPPPCVNAENNQRKGSTPITSPRKNWKEISTKNWILSKINKSSINARVSSIPSPTKSRESENEILLNSSTMVEHCHNTYESEADNIPNSLTNIIKSDAKSKVNMIINRFEASGHMCNVDILANSTVNSSTSCCENDGNNYEPIMNVSNTTK